ncbi:MAG: SBBP repeat-containing protein [Nanoarchaeota archaeon]|nr:SBBP repeat-containing protein [Nanoarchaeota archaeon]MCA9495604.1 SBBP repeat-containing protein [Nanoarchaeota archaeon]
MFHRKGIGPVVATALLIVVAVVSLVAFQNWFNTYSSGMYIDVESQSSSAIVNGGIEAVIGDVLYFKNGFSENLSIISVKIGGFYCSGLNGSYSSGMHNLNISSCIGNVTTLTPDVVVISNKAIYHKQIYLGEKVGVLSGSGSCSYTGNQVWNITYTPHLYQKANAIFVDSNDDIYIAGRKRDSLSNQDFYLIKYLANGTLNWTKEISSGDHDEAHDIVIDSNDNVYVVGTLGTSPALDAYIIKYDSNGNHLWNDTFNGGSVDIGVKIAIDSNDDIYFGIRTYNGANDDVYLRKYNSSSAIKWNQQINNGNADLLKGLTVNSNSGFVYAAYQRVDTGEINIVYRNITSGTGGGSSAFPTYSVSFGDLEADKLTNDIYFFGSLTNTEFMISSLSETLSTNWQKSYGSFGSGENPQDIKYYEGNLYAGGYFTDSTDDFLTMQLDSSSGNMSLNMTTDWGGNDYGMGIAPASDCVVYATGYDAANYDILIVKYQ